VHKPTDVVEKEEEVREITREATRVWTPIDNFNPQYMETIAGRQQRVNYIKENKVNLSIKVTMEIAGTHQNHGE
jgi:hypothetical protein